jgi:hypothetical protein
MYESPSIKDLGTVSELTQAVIHKSAGSGDVIVIGGTSTPVPGGSVSAISGT